MINEKNAPTSTPAPTPIYTEFFSKSSFFSLSNPFTFSKMYTNSAIFTKTGLFPKTDLFSDSNQFKIVFDSSDIKITESDEFSLSTIMYFVANRTGSSITNGKNLKNSVIDVKIDNNPRLILENTDNPLNIKNYKRGYSLIDIEYVNNINTKNADLVLRELNNNSNGYLTLNVDQRIRSISFTSLIIDRISSLQARHRNERLNTLLLDGIDDENDEDIVKIIVKNDINISEKSEVTLTKIELKGILILYDDCFLTFKKETIFDENSIINISFINSKDSCLEPIIKFDGVIDSTPSKIVINFEDKSQSSDLSNYVIFEGIKFKKCLSWIDKFEFVNKDEYAEGGLTHLILSNPKK